MPGKVGTGFPQNPGKNCIATKRQNKERASMKAAVSTPNGLELRDIPQPVPKPNEVLVRVKACGLNRADLSAARASYGHGVMGAAVGLEWAGEVVSCGAEAKGFREGDRVVCSGSGGYAEYAVSDMGRTVPLPAG